MSWNDPEPGDEILDSRSLESKADDLASELEDLREEYEATIEEMRQAEGTLDGEQLSVEARDRLASMRDEIAEVREALDAIVELRGEVGEWYDGATLIHEDHFEDYARDFAEDIGAIDSDAHWPSTCIDWTRAADELKMDYYLVSYGSHDYYVRA